MKDIIKNDPANYITRSSLVSRSMPSAIQMKDGKMVLNPDIVANFLTAEIDGGGYVGMPHYTRPSFGANAQRLADQFLFALPDDIAKPSASWNQAGDSVSFSWSNWQRNVVSSDRVFSWLSITLTEDGRVFFVETGAHGFVGSCGDVGFVPDFGDYIERVRRFLGAGFVSSLDLS